MSESEKIDVFITVNGEPSVAQATITRRGPNESLRMIACAALRFPGGPIICAPRHGGPMVYALMEQIGLVGIEPEYGFCTNRFDEFVTRQEAWKIAEAAGQIRYRCGGDDADGGTLYSENLY